MSCTSQLHRITASIWGYISSLFVFVLLYTGIKKTENLDNIYNIDIILHYKCSNQYLVVILTRYETRLYTPNILFGLSSFNVLDR